MTNHPNRSKQQHATHTPGAVDRLNEGWQFGNKSDPTYAAGNAQFATDVGFLLKSHAELLAALKELVGRSYDALSAYNIQDQRALQNAHEAIAKAEGRT